MVGGLRSELLFAGGRVLLVLIPRPCRRSWQSGQVRFSMRRTVPFVRGRLRGMSGVRKAFAENNASKVYRFIRGLEVP